MTRSPSATRRQTVKDAANAMREAGVCCGWGAMLLLLVVVAAAAAAAAAPGNDVDLESNDLNQMQNALADDWSDDTDRDTAKLDAWVQRELKKLLQQMPSGEAALQFGSSDDGHQKGTRAVVTNNGYPVEEHTVRTDDGYLLKIFRLPRPGRPAVLLMHGLLSSSADYVILSKGRALAFVLYEAGFDVWLPNARGTTESRRHEHLWPTDKEFWDFSWHEIGTSDLPACIDHVLAATNQSALHYIGHSQGTTSFFVLGSERPDYMAKVKTFIALAPVAFLKNIRSVPLRLLSLSPKTLSLLMRLTGIYEFLPDNGFIEWLGDKFCAEHDRTQPICYEILFLIGGTDTEQINKTMLPDILANTPAGAATKQLIHYGQLIHKRRQQFRQFDHGWFNNIKRYGRLEPPDYDLSRVTAETYLIQADNDPLAVQSNVDELMRRLPNVAREHHVPFALFTHLDYVFAKDAKELVYDEVVAIIRGHEKIMAGGK